ncbi:hypothetical protein DFH09DRAFT_1277196 [Mycena vulgaris]|nr:hypothetical protein DFH09DRAFT_1277196 [Mycena vulgaris]
MAFVSPAEERELLQLIADAQTTNYLAAAGITVLVFVAHPDKTYILTVDSSFEHISTFPEERKEINLRLFSVIDLGFFRLKCRCQLEIKSSSAEMIIITVEAVIVDCILFLRLTIGILTILPAKVLMFSMTLYKGCQHLLAVRFTARMPVITLFLRDGVFLFFTILREINSLLYTIAEIIIWTTGRPSLVELPNMLHAVVGARILLNIKNLGTEVNDTTVPTMELSDIFQRNRSIAAKAHIPWYLQTGEQINSEGMNEEIY